MNAFLKHLFLLLSRNKCAIADGASLILLFLPLFIVPSRLVVTVHIGVHFRDYYSGTFILCGTVNVCTSRVRGGNNGGMVGRGTGS